MREGGPDVSSFFWLLTVTDAVVYFGERFHLSLTADGILKRLQSKEIKQRGLLLSSASPLVEAAAKLDVQRFSGIISLKGRRKYSIFLQRSENTIRPASWPRLNHAFALSLIYSPSSSTSVHLLPFVSRLSFALSHTAAQN